MKTQLLAMAAIIGLGWAGLTSASPRACDLGVPFDGTPGPLNAITGVAGIQGVEDAMIAATTMTGADWWTISAPPQPAAAHQVTGALARLSPAAICFA